jgi:hypothetical protein
MPEGEHRVAVWLAFERLDHAYLVRDDEAVERELSVIARLRDDAAAARRPETEPVTSASVAEHGAPPLLSRVAELIGTAVEHISALPVQPVLVRSSEPGRTSQGDARISSDDHRAVGPDLEVSAVTNGVELGIDMVGVDPHAEQRVRLFVEAGGEVVGVTMTSAGPGSGILEATIPWTAALPDELVVVVLPDLPPADRSPA